MVAGGGVKKTHNDVTRQLKITNPSNIRKYTYVLAKHLRLCTISPDNWPMYLHAY